MQAIILFNANTRLCNFETGKTVGISEQERKKLIETALWSMTAGSTTHYRLFDHVSVSTGSHSNSPIAFCHLVPSKELEERGLATHWRHRMQGEAYSMCCPTHSRSGAGQQLLKISPAIELHQVVASVRGEDSIQHVDALGSLQWHAHHRCRRNFRAPKGQENHCQRVLSRCCAIQYFVL